MMKGEPQHRRGYLHLAIAALTCPCHVPIYLAIFGATALGGFLRETLYLFILGLTGVFLVTLSRGFKLIKEERSRERKTISS